MMALLFLFCQAFPFFSCFFFRFVQFPYVVVCLASFGQRALDCNGEPKYKKHLMWSSIWDNAYYDTNRSDKKASVALIYDITTVTSPRDSVRLPSSTLGWLNAC